MHLYLSGALGTMRLRDPYLRPFEPPPPATAPVRFIMGGITLERRIRGF
ncbi:MAG TPA: hypothetical protein VE871_20205 [Longimicrobium sp.]|nr:hypothetical protein [Longimicrobium sp.]